MNYSWKKTMLKEMRENSCLQYDAICEGIKVRAIVNFSSPLLDLKNKRFSLCRIFIKAEENSLTKTNFNLITYDICELINNEFGSENIYDYTYSEYFYVKSFINIKPNFLTFVGNKCYKN